jgi:hypothetical protein
MWVATRGTTADFWSPPVNLGSAVNTSSGQFRPSLSFDGTALYKLNRAANESAGALGQAGG